MQYAGMAAAPRVLCCRRIEDETFARAVKVIDVLFVGSAQTKGICRENERAGREKVAHEAGGTKGGNAGMGIRPPHST